jgi:hypothetical protein
VRAQVLPAPKNGAACEFFGNKRYQDKGRTNRHVRDRESINTMPDGSNERRRFHAIPVHFPITRHQRPTRSHVSSG